MAAIERPHVLNNERMICLDHLPSQLLLQVVLIALNAVFASTEIAVISLNEALLARKAESGDKKARRLAKLVQQPTQFLSTIQIGITLAGFLGSAFAADGFSKYLVNWLLDLGVAIPEKTLNSIAVVIITLILSYFTRVFGELVPKRIAMKKAESLAMLVANFIYVLSKVAAPFVWLLTNSTNVVLRLCRINPQEEEEEVTEEEIRMMVDIGSEKGTIDPQEREYIENVFELDNKSAADIMTHRTDLQVLWADDPLETWEKEIQSGNHSRLPVCGEDVDDILGVLSIRDFYMALRQGVDKTEAMMQYVRPAYFVPESVKIGTLLSNMQKSRHHFAVVIDEYGGVNGVVTIHDLLEELIGIVGDSWDGAEEEEDDIIAVDANTWRIRGTTPLRDVEEALSLDLPDEDYDTFGGLIFDELGMIPEEGSNFPPMELYGLQVKIERIEARRILWTLVCKLNPPAEEATSDSERSKEKRAKDDE